MNFGIANIYAPNDAASRCLMWIALARDLLRGCQWMLLGDYNMVEHWTYKSRRDASMISLQKRTLFEIMKSKLNVEDNPRTSGSFKYSWDNNRPAGARAVARLDRVYLFNQLYRHLTVSCSTIVFEVTFQDWIIIKYLQQSNSRHRQRVKLIGR